MKLLACWCAVAGGDSAPPIRAGALASRDFEALSRCMNGMLAMGCALARLLLTPKSSTNLHCEVKLTARQTHVPMA